MVDFATDQGLVEHYLPTVFVSDVHLGSRYCQAERFLQFLETHRIGDLYLVGDIIDGWRLRRKWWWPDVYHRIFHHLLAMNAAGTRLHYTPGKPRRIPSTLPTRFWFRRNRKRVRLRVDWRRTVSRNAW